MRSLKLIYSVCVLGALFTIQGESQESLRAVAQRNSQLQGGGGFNGGGIKPYPGEGGAGINPFFRAESPYSTSPIAGGTFSRNPDGGITYTGPGGNTANAQIVSRSINNNQYMAFDGSQGGQAIRNPDTGRTFYDGTNMNAIGYRAAGQPTVTYLQRGDGRPTGYTYNWQTGQSTQLDPTPRQNIGENSAVWGSPTRYGYGPVSSGWPYSQVEQGASSQGLGQEWLWPSH